ncbi:hypothetical protein NGB36_06495 [Streptomyces sp. RB6PN25]|uniref:Uncharacterized protein n=1 Tax=Streptomyces humicola TaxID=2953240 RepID=A0ABT1PRF6_9ACTN|nr:hypothetical protein [Streptomyces humicola]MCQ4080254.1 hypothetical protein [Streptomyces humicola]
MISFTKMTAVRSAAACGLSGSRLRGTGLSGVESVRPGAFGVLPLIERPTKAPAAAAAAQASAYAFAANGAGTSEPTVTTQQHQMMRAFRGLEPWRDPA